MSKILLIITLVLTSAFSVQAPAGLQTIHKKDGTSFKAYIKGDVFLNWLKTEDGAIVVFNNKNKKYEYAKLEEKNASKQLVGSGIEYKKNTNSLRTRSILKENISENELNEIREEIRKNNPDTH